MQTNTRTFISKQQYVAATQTARPVGWQEAVARYNVACEMREDLPDGMWTMMKAFADVYRYSNKKKADKLAFADGIEKAYKRYAFKWETDFPTWLDNFIKANNMGYDAVFFIVDGKNGETMYELDELTKVMKEGTPSFQQQTKEALLAWDSMNKPVLEFFQKLARSVAQ